jgi:hypothetical protein
MFGERALGIGHSGIGLGTRQTGGQCLGTVFGDRSDISVYLGRFEDRSRDRSDISVYTVAALSAAPSLFSGQQSGTFSERVDI